MSHDPESGPTKSEEPSVSPKKPKAPKGRRKVEEAAMAWRARNAEYLSRRVLRVETPEQALAIWRRVGEEMDEERKHGKLRGGIGRPKGLSKRAPVVGDSIERQVFDKVEHDRLLQGPDETLEEMVLRWPLPCAFYAPVPPLCDAEILELARQEADEAARRKREEDGQTGEGRLLPGMRRERPF